MDKISSDPRVQSAFAAVYGYQPTVDGKPNPVTVQEFVRKTLKRLVADVVRAHEIRVAQAAAASSYDATAQPLDL